MTRKLSKTQQEIVDQMRQGAYITISTMFAEYFLFDVNGAWLQKITYGTFNALRDKNIIRHEGHDSRHRMKYVLVDTYKETNS